MENRMLKNWILILACGFFLKCSIKKSFYSPITDHQWQISDIFLKNEKSAKNLRDSNFVLTFSKQKNRDRSSSGLILIHPLHVKDIKKYSHPIVRGYVLWSKDSGVFITTNPTSAYGFHSSDMLPFSIFIRNCFRFENAILKIHNNTLSIKLQDSIIINFTKVEK